MTTSFFKDYVVVLIRNTLITKAKFNLQLYYNSFLCLFHPLIDRLIELDLRANFDIGSSFFTCFNCESI